ncbi:uridine phosphorylase [Candidatus Manganitrophus noduliformans]|uniref:Uridine phosphorylase n=1 Tax=Candidatus Manganitrophus noduliformans TaxID=2606439 RepID=A0A7X6ICV6_9BACT|nr:uridine phosphorylase [Candidatus Manganitrophus noduliformans]
MKMANVYHLDLSRSMLKGAALALLPGDPFRVPKIAAQIEARSGEKAVELAWKREYRSFLGTLAGEKVLVTSTGIGGPSTSIAVEELAKLGVRIFLRVGTAGAIQPGMNIGDLVVTTASVRLDGASTHYAPIEYPAVSHPEVLIALIDAARRHEREGISTHVGITASSDTFYAGEERTDGFSHYLLRRLRGLTEEMKRLHVLNFEMESATLLTMCAALGLKGGVITGVVNRRRKKEEKITPERLRAGEENVIRVALTAAERLLALRKKE